MNFARKTTTAVLAASALVLTGCGKGIDDVTPDMPRAEKDEIFTDWAIDKYGEEFPDMDAPAFAEAADGICTAHDVGMAELFYMGLYEDIPLENMGAARDMVNTAVTVYCPEHSNI